MPYRWNPEKRQYETAEGKPVEDSKIRENILAALLAFLLLQQRRTVYYIIQLPIIPIADTLTLIDGTIINVREIPSDLLEQARGMTLERWATETGEDLAGMHNAMAQIASGGSEQMSPGVLAHADRISRAQADFFSGLVTEIAVGEQEPGQSLLGRMGGYVGSGFQTHENVKRTAVKEARDDDELVERRILEPGAKHCVDCLNASARGWQPLGTLPEIGESRCHVNCRCVFEYKVQEEGDVIN